MGFGASRNRGRQVINAAATPEFIGYSPVEEVMSRTIEGAVSHSGTGQVSHLVENARARAGVKISVEEANERYGISKEEAARDGLLPEGLHFSSKDCSMDFIALDALLPSLWLLFEMLHGFAVRRLCKGNQD